MSVLRACLHRGGGPQVGEVTCGGSPHLPCKRDKTKIRNYTNRRVTPPKRVTSPTWGPPPPCKQALSGLNLEKCRGFFPQGKQSKLSVIMRCMSVKRGLIVVTIPEGFTG